MHSGLEFIKVYKTINEKSILNDVSFSVPKGKITAFLGPNGAGKTTSLQIGSKLLSPSSGEVLIEGQPLEKTIHQSFFIPDTPLLYSELTGYEFICFVKDLFKKKMKKGELEDMVNKFKLSNYINQTISQYSLGMKKKLTLLSVLLIKPKLLLLDEYFSGLDPVNLKDIKDLLKEYVSEGRTVLLSTHQLEVAQTFCDSIIMINQGKVVNSALEISSIIETNNSLENYFIESLNEGVNNL